MRDGQPVAPGERGATRIADGVIAKIAAQAAREAVDGALPHASVTVHEKTARVRVAVELEYPTDIGARCRAVRSRIVERVAELAGLEVPEVAVTVERLRSPHLDADRERVR